DRLAVLYPAGSERRQGAAHRARSYPRHPKELGLPAESEVRGAELALSPTGHSPGPRLMRRDSRPARKLSGSAAAIGVESACPECPWRATPHEERASRIRLSSSP